MALFTFTPSLFAEKTPLFIPPQKWQYAPQSQNSPYLIAAFVEKSFSSFRPSINLAKEKNPLPFDQYVSSVIESLKADPLSTFDDLGYIDTKAGKAKILQITKRKDFGDVRLYQMLFSDSNEDMIYVMTGACLNSDVKTYFPKFIDTFSSFTLVDDLFSEIPSKIDRESIEKELKALIRSSNSRDDIYKKPWKNFEKKVIETFSNQGSYWQVLVLQKATNELLMKIAEEKKEMR